MINITPKAGIWQINYTACFFFNNRDLEAIGINLSWKFNAAKSRYKGSHAGQSERNRL